MNVSQYGVDYQYYCQFGDVFQLFVEVLYCLYYVGVGQDWVGCDGNVGFFVLQVGWFNWCRLLCCGLFFDVLQVEVGGEYCQEVVGVGIQCYVIGQCNQFQGEEFVQFDSFLMLGLQVDYQFVDQGVEKVVDGQVVGY